jgi:hypothetical protein
MNKRIMYPEWVFAYVMMTWSVVACSSWAIATIWGP